MADWTLPTVNDTYTNYLAFLKNRDEDLAKFFDPATTTVTAPPTNSIRWNSALFKFEKYNGTSWSDLITTLGIGRTANLTTGVGLDVSGTNAMLQVQPSNAANAIFHMGHGSQAARFVITRTTTGTSVGNDDGTTVTMSSPTHFSGLVGIGVAPQTGNSLYISAPTGVALQVDAAGSAGRIQANQTGVNLGGVLTVTGVASFTAAGTALSVTNNATIGGTLGVTGGITVSAVTPKIANNIALQWRNAADSAWHNVLNYNVSNIVVLNGESGQLDLATGGVTRVSVLASSWSANLPLTLSAAGTALSVTNNATIGGTLGVTGLLTASADISIGTTPATAGSIRLANNVYIQGRNAANTANFRMIGLDTSNRVNIDIDGTAGTVVGGALLLVGGFTVPNTGPHVIGGATNAQVQLRLTGSFTGSAAVQGFLVDGVYTPVAGSDALGVNIAPTLVEAGSGTHVDFASLQIHAPSITPGVATLTNATTLKIVAAPTGATNNRALWVAAGLSEFDGAVQVNGLLTASADISIGTTPATAGSIRLANNVYIQGRNAANTANFRMIGLDTSNRVNIDIDGTAGTVVGGALLLVGPLTLGGDVTRAADQVIDLTGAATRTLTLRNSTASQKTDLVLEDGSLYIGDTANSFMTTGLTINQGSATDEIFAVRNVNVNHGITAVTDTDTYGLMKMLDPGVGGLLIRGLTGSAGGLLSFEVHATCGLEDTTKSALALAPIMFTSSKKSGTGTAAVPSNGNIAVFRNGGTGSTRVIFDAEGDTFQDGTGWTTYDLFDDVEMLNALTYNLLRPDDPIRHKFGGWLLEKRPLLERHKLVTFNADGRHFVNMSKLTMLNTGAIRQLFDMLKQELEKRDGRLERLEARLSQ